MKRIQRTLFAALVSGALALAGSLAHAQSAPPPAEPHGPHAFHGQGSESPRAMQGHEMMMERLKLTDEQKKKMEDIHYQHRRKAIATRAEIATARLDLGRLMRAEDPEERAIDTQIDRMGQLRTGLAKDRIAEMLEARALLTPEQRKTWREMHECMHHGFGGRHGMHPGGRGPSPEGGPETHGL